MEAIYLNKDNQQIWDDFAMKSDSAWFRHTIAWMEYSACCRFDANTRNFSFMVSQGGKIYAIVPLLVEYSYPEREFDCFAMYGDYTPVPAFANDGDIDIAKLMEFIEAEIRKIAAENNIHYGKFVIDPLIRHNYMADFAPFNMMEYGAYVNFSTTNVVDLTLDLDVLLRKMRKGHKAAIKQVWKYEGYRIDVFDKETLTHDLLWKFKEIHKQDAGRQTRTDESWEWMYRWVMDGNGCLTMLWLDSIQDYGAGALINIYKDAAYYGSFATRDSYYLNGHCGYAIQWETIKYLKEHGIARYETGRNYFANNGDVDRAKLHEISKYQRGYRSVEVPKITYRWEFL